jgi:hypothetical protein
MEWLSRHKNLEHQLHDMFVIREDTNEDIRSIGYMENNDAVKHVWNGRVRTNGRRLCRGTW